MPLDPQYTQLYINAAKQYNLDPDLLIAQAEQESSGDPNAVGETTKYGQATGIAQLLPSTAKALGVTDPTDPTQAIPAQAKLMAENMARYKDPEKALMAYHGGTDERNWGEKTRAYPASVYKHYKSKEKQMAQDTATDTTIIPMAANLVDSAEEDIDPVEYARAKLAKTNGASSEDDIDPVEYARKKLSEKAAEAKRNTPDRPVGVGEDLALTAISAPIKAIGALPQIPAMAGNAIANATGYVYGKAAGATDEQQKKLNNLNPFFTGNTPADALLQAGKGVIGEDPGEANQLTGAVLHDPQHAPAKIANAAIQSAIAGPQTGLKMAPSIGGGLGAEAASEAFPGNPLAPVVGGLAGGLVPPAIKSVKVRATPQELAGNLINENMGGFAPEGEFSFPKENPLVPGVQNTLTEVTGNPNVALMQRQLQSKNPAGFKDRENANESAREQYFDKASGTPQDIETMVKAREAQRAADTANIFKPGQDAKATPVIKKIDEILNGPGGERTAVKNTLTKIRSMIAKEKDGAMALEKSPEKLYRSVKHEIEDMMDKKNLNNPEGRQASYELNQVKQVLDDVIEKATPGYKKYLDNYREASAKIDASQWLQDLKLTDAGGKYTLAKVKNALENAKSQRKDRGIQDAKHLTKDQMETLQNLHDDLLKREQPMRESMDRGSPTKQNLLAEAGMQSKLGATNAILGVPSPEMAGVMAGSALSKITGIPGGAYLGSLAGRYSNYKSGQRTQAANQSIENFILNPKEYKEYLLKGSDETYSKRFLNKLLADQP